MPAKGQNLRGQSRPRRKKGGLAAALFVFVTQRAYRQRCRRPSSPLNHLPGWQTKPLRSA
ncbi:hypothetical protein SAMN05444169_7943 [Bradyrhizobium erythrophlei]|uniref:Uncharacterized protein n=1 Tax=Bradyrhizobium erythrophlei TaxID=1437360 RepID=A0A1M5TRX8_9BRAD|nr:hypothetical protein SAMN05444169_7943 [Bradyrhizobium erythrophlei]